LIIFSTDIKKEIFMKHVIEHKSGETKGAFVIKVGGESRGELTYSKAGDTKIIIDHTHVDESLRGTGVGKELVMNAAAWAREEGVTVIPLCPYAKIVFEQTKELHDLL
jgi:predicted GNAT family acetyltransferase